MEKTARVLSRAKKTKLNIVMSFVYQLVAAVISLVLPRFVLAEYGSEANGLMQAITQLLSYTLLLEFGVGGLIRASFYKPLANNDTEAISDIFNNTKHYFGKISAVFLVFTVFLTICSKLLIKTEFDFMYVGAMVVILSLNTYFSYYFALPHRLLISADQKVYILQSVQTITNIVNFLVCIVAIKMGFGVHAMKLISMVAFLITPIVLRWHVTKNYNISKKVFDKGRTIPRKTDGMVHHMAYFIHRSTDVVILSAVCGVKSASVYTVYNAVIVMAENLLNSMATGMAAAIGNMLAKNEQEELNTSFDKYEAFNTFLAFAFSTVMAILIIPFVKIYTKGVTDIDYIQPAFAYLMIAAGLMYCIRMPYNTVITSAGHYRETKVEAIVEVCINLGLSFLLVKPLGLSGVAIGTLCAMSYRSGYMVWYLSKNIIERPVLKFVKGFGINAAASVVIICVFEKFFKFTYDSLWEFVLYGAPIALIVFVILAGVNVLINFDVIKKVRK